MKRERISEVLFRVEETCAILGAMSLHALHVTVFVLRDVFHLLHGLFDVVRSLKAWNVISIRHKKNKKNVLSKPPSLFTYLWIQIQSRGEVLNGAAFLS